MGASGFFIDANLLVLLVAGSVDTRLIGRHRRLREFTVEQYEGLRELVGAAERVFVMPNTLTTPETPLVTVDLHLYVVASKVDHRAAFNFNHLYGHW